VQKLHLVGFTTDHEGLILSARRGTRSGGYVLAIDDALEEAVDDLRARRADEHEDGDDDVVASRPTRVESTLPVREIQARLRQGRSVAEVAKAAGVGVDWVERFAPPVLAERAQVIAKVQAMPLRRSRLGPSAQPIGDAVRHHLADRGVALTPDEYADAWTARQVAEGRWAVRCSFHYRGRTHVLRFDLDESTGGVTAADRVSGQMGYVAPAAAPASSGAVRRQAKAKSSPRPTAKRAVVSTGFRPDRAPAKTASRSAKERQRAAQAMRRAAAQRAVEAERAAARRVRERAAEAARKERADKATAAREIREQRQREQAAAAAERAKVAAAKAKEAAAKKIAAERAKAATKKAAAAKQAAAKQAATTKKKAAAKQAAATKKKAAAKKAAATKKQAAAKKAATRKAAPRTKAVVKKAAVKKPAVKAAAVKAAAVKAAVKKPAVKQAAVKKPAVKQLPEKKTPARASAAVRKAAVANGPVQRTAARPPALPTAGPSSVRPPATPGSTVRPKAAPASGLPLATRPALSPLPPRPIAPRPAPVVSTARPSAPPTTTARPAAPSPVVSPRPMPSTSPAVERAVGLAGSNPPLVRPLDPTQRSGPGPRPSFREGLAEQVTAPVQPSPNGLDGGPVRPRPDRPRRTRPLRAT
jgi:chemotaxis protein histidine kinase CheA